jgi:hypothetical protein
MNRIDGVDDRKFHLFVPPDKVEEAQKFWGSSVVVHPIGRIAVTGKGGDTYRRKPE